MILSAHQPAYLCWLGYLAKIRDSDAFIILDNVPRSHGDWTNRNRIKTQHGEQLLTVPLLGGRQQIIQDIRVDGGRRWRHKHWRAIELAYSKAPFWETYADGLNRILVDAGPTLLQVDMALTHWLLDAYGVGTPVLYASAVEPEGSGTDMIVALCQKLGAREFLFGSEGRDYANDSTLSAAGITAHFQQYECKEYPQLHGEFLPRLSALDALLNLGPAAKEIL